LISGQDISGDTEKKGQLNFVRILKKSLLISGEFRLKGSYPFAAL